jgi:ATP synthase protein I
MANLNGPSRMADPDPKRQLQDLDARLGALKAAQKSGKAHQEEHYSQAQVAWRMVTEMVAGLGIGFGIGYGLDYAFGTTPFLMVLFTLLGVAAGINVMLRTAKEVQAKQQGAAAPTDKTGGPERGEHEGN